MKRIVYYVWYATIEENQNNNQHVSGAMLSEKEAMAFANKLWLTNDYVSVQRSHETFEHNAWRSTMTENIDLEVV